MWQAINDAAWYRAAWLDAVSWMMIGGILVGLLVLWVRGRR
jgi:hypothetical protein